MNDRQNTLPPLPANADPRIVAAVHEAFGPQPGTGVDAMETVEAPVVRLLGQGAVSDMPTEKKPAVITQLSDADFPPPVQPGGWGEFATDAQHSAVQSQSKK